MFCTHCGTNTGESPFCSACGASTAEQSSAAQFAEPASPSESPRSSTPLVVAAATVALVVLVLLAVIFLNTRDEPDPVAVASAAVDTVTPVSSAAAPETATAPAEPTENKPPRHDGPGNVTGLEAGLFCRDLNTRGYSYAAAVDYWRMHGQPDQMDIDLNGLPCETVYPSLNVTSYWGARQEPGSGVAANAPQVTIPAVSALPSGLFCRDLYARGYSYSAAVDYWWMYGEPSQMDIDYNSIPCETVYSALDVNAFWY